MHGVSFSELERLRKELAEAQKQQHSQSSDDGREPLSSGDGRVSVSEQPLVKMKTHFVSVPGSFWNGEEEEGIKTGWARGGDRR